MSSDNWKQNYTTLPLSAILNKVGQEFTPKKGNKIELVEVSAVDVSRNVVIFRVLTSKA